MKLSDICVKSLIKNYLEVKSLVGLPDSMAKLFLDKARERGISTTMEFLRIYLEFTLEPLIVQLQIKEFHTLLGRNLFLVYISSLDLSNQPINDDDVLQVLKMINLSSLNISFTLVSDLGLSHLARSRTKLNYLNISGTKIRNFNKIFKFPSLRLINVSYLVSKKESIAIFQNFGWELLLKEPCIESTEISKDFKAWILDLPSSTWLPLVKSKILEPYLACKPLLIFTKLF